MTLPVAEPGASIASQRITSAISSVRGDPAQRDVGDDLRAAAALRDIRRSSPTP